MNNVRSARAVASLPGMLLGLTALTAAALLAGCGSSETSRTTTTEQTRTMQPVPMMQPAASVTTTKTQVTTP